MRDSVIVSAARVPTGKFLGALKDFSAPQLGAIVVKESIARAGLDPASVDECIMGNVVSAGVGQNPARQAALGAGLPDKVAAFTVNQVCGSGLKAVMLASQSIASGDAQVVVAGGMESMSNAPYLLRKLREGLRLGHSEAVDSMIHDGLWCAFEHWHMGMTGEAVAEKYGLTRAQQDAYAACSHRKAAAAIREGWFRDEIVAVPVAAEEGPACRLRSGRACSSRHDERVARTAQARVQEGRDSYRGECTRRQRRCGRSSRRRSWPCGGARPHATGADRRAVDERAPPQVGDDDAGGRHSARRRKGRVGARGRGPVRGQRGILRAGAGSHRRARAGSRIASMSTGAPWRSVTPSARVVHAS